MDFCSTTDIIKKTSVVLTDFSLFLDFFLSQNRAVRDPRAQPDTICNHPAAISFTSALCIQPCCCLVTGWPLTPGDDFPPRGWWLQGGRGVVCYQAEQMPSSKRLSVSLPLTPVSLPLPSLCTFISVHVNISLFVSLSAIRSYWGAWKVIFDNKREHMRV